MKFQEILSSNENGKNTNKFKIVLYYWQKTEKTNVIYNIILFCDYIYVLFCQIALIILYAEMNGKWCSCVIYQQGRNAEATPLNHLRVCW